MKMQYINSVFKYVDDKLKNLRKVIGLNVHRTDYSIIVLRVNIVEVVESAWPSKVIVLSIQRKTVLFTADFRWSVCVHNRSPRKVEHVKSQIV